MANLSVIIPTYRNPKYLDLCLKSAIENKADKDTEIIVIVDGFVKESADIVKKYATKGIGVLEYDDNRGMQYALNLGVMNASNEYVFIINDDNVFPTHWDCRIGHFNNEILKENMVTTICQVEPAKGIFDFEVNDLGRAVDTFKYEAWLEYEKTIANNSHSVNGRLFPFIISKRWYMAVGGFDTFYKSPFWCDVDWWLKLELTKQLSFTRWHGCHFYHFGSIATKNRGDSESFLFKQSESVAAQQFQYKWGFIPNIVENAARGNTKLPTTPNVRGIHFNGNGITAATGSTPRVG